MAIHVTAKYREPCPGSGSKKIHGQRLARKVLRESEVFGRAILGIWKADMIETIERMLSEMERGKLSRRELVVSLAALAAGASTAAGALAAPAKTGFQAVSINHVTVRVPDIQRTSQFYQEFFGMPLRQQSATVIILGVGDSFFGIEQAQGNTASVDHLDFGIANFNADNVRAKLRDRGLKSDSSSSKESFKFYDPDGFQLQVNSADYKGHVN
jgi:catechol 2,3-dioxygenase-like lactoylglutathione lyase family enzyme